MRILLTISCCLCISFGMAQYRFDHLSVSDGLSQNSINDLLQDHEGYLWFATQDGLNKYDGHQFEVFDPDSPTPISDKYIWGLTEDQHGNIWLASANGVTRLQWKKQRSTFFHIMWPDGSYDIANRQVNRTMTVGDRVAFSFDGQQTWFMDPLLFEDSTRVTLTTDLISSHPSIEVWEEPLLNSIKSAEVAYYLFEDKVIGVDTLSMPDGYLSSKFKSAMLKSKTGIYIGTEKGLLFLDTETQSISTIQCIEVPVTSLCTGSQPDQIWVGTENGTLILNINSKECNNQIISGDGPYDLSNNHIASLLKTQEGMIWAGTANGGLNVYDPVKDQFKYLNQQSGLTDKPVWSVYQEGNVLLTGSENGLFKATLSNNLSSELFAKDAIQLVDRIKHPALEGKRITAIVHLTGQKFLIGTHDEEIISYDLDTENAHIITLDESDFHPHVVSGIQVLGRAIWVATHNGLFKFSYDLSSYEYFDYWQDSINFPTNYYLSIYASSDSLLWVGSNVGMQSIDQQGKVTHYPHDPNDLKNSPAYKFVNGFYEDPLGRLWMATFGGGLSMLDRKTGTFSHFTKKDGLVHNVCAAIQGDEKSVFVSTNAGISKVDLLSGKIKNFTIEDGLVSREFAIAASYANQNGTLFFGTVNGLTLFHPDSLLAPATIVPPTITNVSINHLDKPMNILAGDHLDLFPGDKNFDLTFAQLSYRHKDQIPFQYQLKGFDHDWVNASPYNFRASYSLNPGTYFFEVRALKDGATSPTTSVTVVMHPAFYQTWWFIGLLIIALVFLIFLLVRYFANRKLREKLRKMEVQQKIQNERERISRDLHDNVGSQITYIASSLDNYSARENSEELREIGEYTRDTMRQLRETIWVINQEEVTTEDLKIKVFNYLNEMVKFEDKVNHQVDFCCRELTLVPTVAINLLRIIQEAVNNAMKHANPSLIKIKLEMGANNLLTISDDGRGFDGQQKTGHFGLLNMKKRAQELGAKFSVNSEKDSGTTVEVIGFKIGQMT